MNILLVEDNSQLAEYIALELGGNVKIAGSLEEAKTLLERESFNLVLLDLGLPDSQGLDTIKVIKEFGLPIVVLTANDTLAEEACKLEIVDYLVKRDMKALMLRIRFNIAKIAKSTKVRKPRFDEHVFSQIKACLTVGANHDLVLTH